MTVGAPSTPRTRGLLLFTCCLATGAIQTPSLCTLFHPLAVLANSPESSFLYVSPSGLSGLLKLCYRPQQWQNSKKKKKKRKEEEEEKSAVCSGANPNSGTGLHCGQQQLKSVTPGPHPSGFQHQPWPLTHTKLQPRVWMEACFREMQQC